MRLRTRAILTLGAIESVVMLLIIIVSIHYLHMSGMSHLREKANDILVLISSAVAESLFVSNLSSAAEIVDTAFFDIQGIDYIQVIDEDNSVIVEKRKGSDLLNNEKIIATRTIELGGVTFGTFHMHYSTQSVVDSVNRQTLILLSFAFLGLAVSGGLTWAAVGHIGNILQEIERGLSAIDENAEKLKVPAGQELSNLVNSYNKLVEKLHKRPGELNGRL